RFAAGNVRPIVGARRCRPRRRRRGSRPVPRAGGPSWRVGLLEPPLDPLNYGTGDLGIGTRELTGGLRTLAVPVPSPWSLVPSFLRNSDCVGCRDYSSVEE